MTKRGLINFSEKFNTYISLSNYTNYYYNEQISWSEMKQRHYFLIQNASNNITVHLWSRTLSSGPPTFWLVSLILNTDKFVHTCRHCWKDDNILSTVTSDTTFITIIVYKIQDTIVFGFFIVIFFFSSACARRRLLPL